jgi:ribA/ribD-fused uncharacterized protein
MRTKAQDSSPITFFRGTHFFLSNFYPVEIFFAGAVYPSVEHAYQAAKQTDPEKRERLRSSSSASEAKQLGKKFGSPPDWHQRSLQIMEELTWQKFFKHRLLGDWLLRTGDRPLIEGNTWGDTFYGACFQNGEWIGHNHLGKLLMQHRDRLRTWRNKEKTCS